MHKPCQFPFYTISISPTGGLAPCCAFVGEVTRVDEVESIADHWMNSEPWTRLRQREKEGRWTLPGCKSCRINENKSVIRKDRFSSYVENSESADCSTVELKYLDITFGNLCNLACLMCGSRFSSMWVRHENTFAVEDGMEPTAKSWSISYEKLDQIAAWVNATKTLESIEIKGGEPFFDKKALYFFEKIKGFDRPIHIVTNGTMLNDVNVELMSHFPRRTIAVSVDGLGKTYEWIRGHSFEKLEANIIKYFRRLVPGDDVGIFNYVSTKYNMGALNDFWEWLIKITNETGVPCVPDFSLVVLDPFHLSPAMTNDVPAALRDIDRLMNNLTKCGYFRADRLAMTLNHLEILKQVLVSETEGEPEELLAENAKWHQRYTKMRGWDILATT